MNVVYVASEVFPFFKTGGLADVMYSLPRKMSRIGHDVSVIMPKYSQISQIYTRKMEHVISVEYSGRVFNIYKIVEGYVIYYFVENKELFERSQVYGCDDEDIQFSVFCEIVLKFLRKIQLKADIIHCNDWQTGLLPFFLKKRYILSDEFFANMKTVFTIHNLMYQGKFSKTSLHRLGYDVEGDGLNFMRIGMEYADIVTTVSKTYAEEIKYPYFSEGLEDMTTSKKIYGVLNGIDVIYFNPERNSSIYVNYNIYTRKDKAKNKMFLQQEMKLPETSETPVISMITRLVEGKGMDLVRYNIEELLKDPVQVIILGSGDKEYEEFFWNLEKKYPSKFKIKLGYDPVLANKIYAGSDMFLMPSRYEPCGLSQMIAMKFGTIPIVRETGGLKDTVTSYNKYTGEGNGFTFANFNADDMLYTLRRAERYYFNDKGVWDKLIERNMNLDFSWIRSAREYEKLYWIAKGDKVLKADLAEK